MPTETVTLVLDKAQYERALADVVAGQGRLSRSGEQIGAGFLRGDRAVRVATANIVQGLATATNAADATLFTMQSLERVFRIPIGATILAAGGIALIDVISRALDKARELRQEIQQITRLGLTGTSDFLNTDQINANLSKATEKINQIVKDTQELKAGKGKFLGVDLMGSETRAFFINENEKQLAQLRGQASEDVLKLTEKQNELNRVEIKRRDNAEDLADLDKLEIDHKERLGKLAEMIATADLKGTDAAHQLLSVENDRYNIAVQILKTKQQEAQLAKSIKTAGAITDFFSDIGSGKFIQNFQAEQKREADAQRGREQIEGFRRDREAGIPLGPVAQAELRQADRLAKREKVGLPALLNADFTNLLDLSKYDFSGLLPLSGLTLQIQ